MNMGWFLMEEFETLLKEQSLPGDDISIESKDGGKLKVLLKNNVQITGVHSAEDWSGKPTVFAKIDPGLFNAFPDGLYIRAAATTTWNDVGTLHVTIGDADTVDQEFSDGIRSALKRVVGY